MLLTASLVPRLKIITGGYFLANWLILRPEFTVALLWELGKNYLPVCSFMEGNVNP